MYYITYKSISIVALEYSFHVQYIYTMTVRC